MPRTLIEPHKGDKRYVRRKKGKFTSKQVGVEQAYLDEVERALRCAGRSCRGPVRIALIHRRELSSTY